MKIKEAISYGKNVLKKNKMEDSNIIANVLLQYILKKDKTYLVINTEKELEKEQEDIYIKYLELIIEGKPIQYITNKQEFMNLEFYVDENVLIPQPDTEILVEEVISICKEIEAKNEKVNVESNIKLNRQEENKREIRILDICTGSGAIGISIAKYTKNTKIIVSDISKKAIQIAKLNCEKNNLKNRMEFIISDMFENINGKFDVIVSNPPYIKTNVIKQLKKDVQNEPNIALDGGKDGLEFYRILANKSYEYLNKGGYLCMEIGYDQKKQVIELIEQQNKYKDIYSKKDLENNDRIIISKF